MVHAEEFTACLYNHMAHPLTSTEELHLCAWETLGVDQQTSLKERGLERNFLAIDAARHVPITSWLVQHCIGAAVSELSCNIRGHLNMHH